MASPRRRTILITGCSQGGIGDALAREFFTRGCVVYATSRRLARMQHLSAMGIKILELDVTDERAIQRVKEQVEQEQDGKLDVLVNNAGQSLICPATESDMARVRALFDTNLFGAMTMVRAFAPLLIAAGDGLITSVGSIVGICPAPFGAAYNASKAALHAYNDTLRIELRPFNVRVVNLITGGVRTNIIQESHIPAGSMYEGYDPIFQQIRKVTEAPAARTTPEAYAKTVVAEALKKRPREWLWEGSAAWIVWFGNTFLPRWGFEVILWRLFGLNRWVKTLKEKRKRA